MNNTKKKKRWIWLIVIAALIAVALVSFQVMQQQAKTALDIALVKTVTAETGSITKTVSGSGTLQTQNTFDVKTVLGVKIEKVLVDAGDSVTAGQPLATLDKEKLNELTADTDMALKQLDMELMRFSGKEATKKVTAPVEGRIKQIFIKEGDDAVLVTAANNALMILSTDGMMKLDFTPSITLAVGDSVYVSDGDKIYSAKIAASSPSVCTAQLSDNGPVAGNTGIVLSGDKTTELGKGVLAVNNPVAINASGGKIDKIYADLNEKVKRNEKLLSLTQIPLSSDYLKKLAERDQKAKDYAKVLAMAGNPVITAPSDGVVKELLIADGEITAGKSQSDTDAVVFKLNEKVLELNISLDELDMPFVKSGLSASVSFDALPDQEFPAVIDQISSLGTPENGNTKYSVILSLSELDGLYEGMSATATITVETKQNVVSLPLDALQEENGENFVYMQSGKPGVLGEIRKVKTGLSDGKKVEITEGIKAGDGIMYKIKVEDTATIMGLPAPGGSAPFSGLRQQNQPATDSQSGNTPASSAAQTGK